MRKSIISVAAALVTAGSLSTVVKAAEKVSIPFGAFWVQTGVFKSFGVNSKAVYEAFVEELHCQRRRQIERRPHWHDFDHVL